MKREDAKLGAVVGYAKNGYWSAKKGTIVFIGTDYVRVEYDELQTSSDALPGETKMVTVDVNTRKLIFPWVADPDRDADILARRKERAMEIARREKLNEALKSIGIALEIPKAGRPIYKTESINVPVDKLVKLARKLNGAKR